MSSQIVPPMDGRMRALSAYITHPPQHPPKYPPGCLLLGCPRPPHQNPTFCSSHPYPPLNPPIPRPDRDLCTPTRNRRPTMESKPEPCGLGTEGSVVLARYREIQPMKKPSQAASKVFLTSLLPMSLSCGSSETVMISQSRRSFAQRNTQVLFQMIMSICRMMFTILSLTYFTNSSVDYCRQRGGSKTIACSSKGGRNYDNKKQAEQRKPNSNRGRKSYKRQREQGGGEDSEAEDDHYGEDDDAGGVDEGAEDEDEDLGGWLQEPRFYSGGDGRARTCEDPLLVLPMQHSEA
ncbi:hypothetical protein BDD12DRAFT_201110 [Trichophaea hybrida]|nr:hypothetical protein BDD12DRAFT_201110 [Trichophaea hybrida]